MMKLLQHSLRLNSVWIQLETIIYCSTLLSIKTHFFKEILNQLGLKSSQKDSDKD